MDYRGYIIDKLNWQGTDYYRATAPRKLPLTGLRFYVATDYDLIGIMRAVDDYIATGRRQYRVS